ncbi:MAG: hypothetical protein JEZ03_15020 [Bacteroidales bacterium]|nr:hypothetical protein [Bacteroidales bacterium]
MNAKKRVIVDYKTLPQEILEKLAMNYPNGFNGGVIKFKNSKGDTISAVPVETEDTYYMVKVSVQLRQMVDDVELDEDDDVDDDVELPEDTEDDDDF